jgi:hypothetical protein
MIAREIASGTIFVICEECYSEWPSPEAIRGPALPWESFDKYEILSRDEVMRHPWAQFLVR